MINVDVVKTANAGSVTSLNIDYPLASEVQGNVPPDTSYSVYVAVITARPAGGPAPTITGPAGWTLVDSVGNLNDTLEVYYKNYDASTGSVSWTTNNSAIISGVIILLSGANLSAPAAITISDDATSAFTTLHTVGPVTTAYDNSLLIGSWFEGNSQVKAVPPSDLSVLVQTIGSSPSGQNGLTIAYRAQGTAGTSGTKTGTSVQMPSGTLANGSEAMLLVAVNPYLGPSAPTLIQPDGGNQITQNTTYSITWTAATHPTVAQSSLQYHIQYSANDGVTWTDIVALSSAGVTSYSWSLSGLAVGIIYRVRIRAWDGTRFGPYDTSATAFSIIADQTPGAPLSPVVQQPAGTNVTIADRASGIRFVWTHNDIGDPQSGYEIRHSANADMSSPTTVSATSANQYHDFVGATFAQGTRYWDVRTKDTAGTYGPRTATQSFFAGDKPATPNITAPTAGSPPTSSTPTITWTSSGQTQYRYRWLLDSNGSQVYDSGFVVSTALSVVSAYFLTTGIAVRLKVSIKNVDGIASDEDSETMTPSFTAPATPTIEVTDAGHFLQATITNSDAQDHNDLYRDGVRIAEGIAMDGSFSDYNVAHGVTYSYVARAVSAAGLIADSSADTESVSLDLLWVHAVTKSSTTGNLVTGTAIGLIIIPPLVRERIRTVSFKHCPGRSAPFAVFGQAIRHRLYAQLRVPVANLSDIAVLKAAYDQNSDVCVRDPKGNLLFGRVSRVSESATPSYTDISLEVVETDYDEEIV